MEIGPRVDVEQPIEERLAREGIEVRALNGIWVGGCRADTIAQLGTEDLRLPGAREYGEVVEVNRGDIRRQVERRSLQLLPELRLTRQSGNGAANGCSQRARREPLIANAQGHIDDSRSVSAVSSEHLVASFSGEHHLHVLRGEAGNSI